VDEINLVNGYLRNGAYFHELLAHEVSDVVYISWKRITAASGTVLWRRLVSAAQGLVQYISRGVVAGQTEANEIENGGTLDPGVCLGGAIEASITIDLGGTGHIRIHSRLAERDIVGREIAVRLFRH
jgi:hypothetical protein